MRGENLAAAEFVQWEWAIPRRGAKKQSGLTRAQIPAHRLLVWLSLGEPRMAKAGRCASGKDLLP